MKTEEAATPAPHVIFSDAASFPHYRGLTLAIFAGAFVFGVVMASLGAMLPGLVEKIGFDKGGAGALFLAMNFAMLIGSLVFGPVCDRFGFRLLLLASIVLVGAAYTSLALAGSYAAITFSLAALGLGGGALNGATNALVNDISPERRGAALNSLGIFFGVGALVTPFLIGALNGRLGLRAIICLFALFTLAPFVLYLTVDFPAPKHAGGLPRGELAAVLRSPLLYLFAFVLFFQSGNEFTVGGWLSTFLAERFRIEAGQAAFVLAGYWAAVMAGRSVCGWLSGRVKGATLVCASALLAAAAVACLLLAQSGAVAIAAVIFIGLGFAAIFPTTLAQAGEAFAQFSGTAFSVIFVVALSGGMTAPWLAGKIAQTRSIETGLGLVIFNCAMIFLLQLIVARRRSQRA
ncbi:MAG TPA: MFS transporter [Blastocatellia bacterium]|nr:MFS transporter [Blastocatellia bacterium]